MLAAEPHEDFEVLVTALILRRRNGAVSLRASFLHGLCLLLVRALWLMEERASCRLFPL